MIPKPAMCRHGFLAGHCPVGSRPPCVPPRPETKRRRNVSPVARPTGGTIHRIYAEAPDRTWTGDEKATDEAMNVVLEVLLERGRSYQSDIVDEVQTRLGIKRGTAAAYVSGSLLYLSEVGFVRYVESEGARAIWESCD